MNSHDTVAIFIYTPAVHKEKKKKLSNLHSNSLIITNLKRKALVE